MSDERDPIIDSLLDEVLGGQEPPDLTRRILGAHEATRDESVHVRPASAASGRKSSHRPQHARNLSRYTGWGVAAVVLVGATLFGLWVRHEQRRMDIVNQPPPDVAPTNAPTQPAESAIADAPTPTDKLEGQEESTELPEWATPGPLLKKLRDQRLAQSGNNASDTQSVTVPDVDSPVFRRTMTLQPAASDSQMVAFINERLAEGWRKARVTPTNAILSDQVWLARATYTLAGREPSAAELEQLAANPDREAAIQRLMAHEDFAHHWAQRFTDILIGSASGRDFNRAALEGFLAESFQANKAFDQLAYELITAQGAEGKSGGTNPAVNFILAHQSSGRAQPQVTDKLCQVFLGTQAQCARCHDHPFNESLGQQTYWEMAAFLTQMRKEKTSDGVLLVDRDDTGTDGKSPQEADLFYTKPDETLSVAYAKFPGSKEPPIQSGLVEDAHRRVKLAYSIVESDRFALAIMNRLWRQVFGQGFTQPVDDMGRHNGVSHPRLLAGLAREFKNSGYDLQTALRWIVRSNIFDREIRTKNDPLIAQGGFDAFSSFPRKRLISYPDIGKPLAIAAANATRNPDEILANLAATNKLSPAAAARELEKINAIHRERLLSTQAGGLLQRLTQNRSLDDRQALEHLFFALLGRPPSKAERTDGESILATRTRRDGLIEIGQIILNSREFTTEH